MPHPVRSCRVCRSFTVRSDSTQGFDQYGAAIDRTVDGFHARVVQHEVDHLDGVLYPMRIQDLSRFGFQDVLFPGQEPGED